MVTLYVTQGGPLGLSLSLSFPLEELSKVALDSKISVRYPSPPSLHSIQEEEEDEATTKAKAKATRRRHVEEEEETVSVDIVAVVQEAVVALVVTEEGECCLYATAQ